MFCIFELPIDGISFSTIYRLAKSNINEVVPIMLYTYILAKMHLCFTIDRQWHYVYFYTSFVVTHSKVQVVVILLIPQEYHYYLVVVGTFECIIMKDA